MGQRSKVLDTEGQTPKFLYAIIKQLDMKSVDWNRVASDLEISNGHAARMRYSRFKSQMEPSSAQKNSRKRNTKKGDKGDPKGEMPAAAPVPMPMQMPFPMAPPAPVPKMEPYGPPFSNQFVKCEPGSQEESSNPGLAEIPDFQHQLSQAMSPNNMPYPPHLPQYVPHGMQFPMVSGVSPSISSLNISHYGDSYPSMAPSSDVSMQNFSLQQPAFHNAPVITWEPPAPAQGESTPVEHTPVKIEDEVEIVDKIAFHDVFRDVPLKVEETCKG